MTETESPTQNPIYPSDAPATKAPTTVPSFNPPTSPDPTNVPTSKPQASPSDGPASTPPTAFPSLVPTGGPTSDPTMHPTARPSLVPSRLPTTHPSSNPTKGPTSVPVRGSPTAIPSTSPTMFPSALPTKSSTLLPSLQIPAPVAVETPPPVVLGPYPSGPYVSTTSNSETIVLPEPEAPVEQGEKRDCPHWELNLLMWNDPSTWPSGSVPGAGEDVVLPPGRVLVTTSLLLGTVSIPIGSELIVGEDVVNGIEIDADGIVVSGILTIGSETCKIDSSVAITLHGSRPVDAVTNPPGPAVKGLDVTGTLHLHGKRYFQTWSRLAHTADVGESVVVLQQPVNWEIGQQVVVVTSSMKDSREFHQNEVRTITGVHPNPPAAVGAIVYLDEPLVYRHIANANYQVEVGLLSRSIKVQGAVDDSEPIDLDPLDCSNAIEWHFQKRTPCPYKEITGYGGHIMVRGGGRGYVEGVELFRMGQTNVLGRYPMHFHLLGDCPDCYFRNSAVHHSFYRCISIHGTNSTTVTENVAFDVTGYCYYLEDGIEEMNTISFNLAAHVKMIGDIPWGSGQGAVNFDQSDQLTLPADVAASGFYITNLHNHLVGNAASGGWAGFAFPILDTPLGPHRDIPFEPKKRPFLTANGNTAHSTTWWWTEHAGAFYFGGHLYFNPDGSLHYNPGRGGNRESTPGIISNTKTFLNAGVGLNSWTGKMDVIGFESHDNGLSLEALEAGFYVSNMLAVCRTGEDLGFPTEEAQGYRVLKARGFVWYDTWQEHIITDSTFRSCGYNTDQNDDFGRGGCDESTPNNNGCDSSSAVFGFLTHSDEFNPEIMQATRGLTFENCGRRFRFSHEDRDSVSGRSQNWLDADGTASNMPGQPILIGSGLDSVIDWWKVDDQSLYKPDSRIVLIQKNNGPNRNIGHMLFRWDDSLHDQIGSTLCVNGWDPDICPPVGWIRHLGPMFDPSLGDSNPGMAVTASAEVAGPTGGFGWLLSLDGGSPRNLNINLFEVYPDSPMVLAIQYPIGATVEVSAEARYCSEEWGRKCREVYSSAASVQEVRNGPGNLYYLDASTGVVYIRVVQFSNWYIEDDWFLLTFDNHGSNGYELPHFERDGIILPNQIWGADIWLRATCAGSGAYCDETLPTVSLEVCPSGFTQESYDRCCDGNGNCVFADGSTGPRP